jgi:catechol 2,3-dioxygenase-like lactoylglutathione lyase family enzyme
MQINGIAHIQLTVRNVKESTKFYEPLLHFLGLKTLIRGEPGWRPRGWAGGCGVEWPLEALDAGAYLRRQGRLGT